MEVRSTDAVVVGAGFAGLYMLHRLRGLGLATTVRRRHVVLEPLPRRALRLRKHSTATRSRRNSIASGSGPSAIRITPRSGATSTTSRPPRPEARHPLRHPRHGRALRRRREPLARDDRRRQLTAQFLITAVGCLSTANVPDIPGREHFDGRWFHTGQWPHDGVDFTGRRVGQIGTGSTGIQAAPVIAEPPRISRSSSAPRTTACRRATRRSRRNSRRGSARTAQPSAR
jgi:cation diffusion facilitator CzcD-associated flavoprotein CzcO